MPEIQSLSHRHDAILTFVLANPTMPLWQVAQYFNVSQPWLSVVIHSDIFQKKLRERQDLVFNATLLPIAAKIEHLAHQALDKLTEKVEMGVVGEETLRKTADMALQSLGYGTRGNSPAAANGNFTQVNNYIVDREVLAQARARLTKEPIPGDFRRTLPQADEPVNEEVGMTDDQEELYAGASEGLSPGGDS